MSAEVVAFPGAFDPPDPGSARPVGKRAAGRRVYDIVDMARLTGLINVGQRTLVDCLRTLAARKGMPAPITPRRHAGQILTGTDAIGQRALWDAAAVDRWLDPVSPTPTGAAAPVPSLAHGLHAMMRSRAQQLRVSG